MLEVQLEEMRAEREKLVSGKEATSKTMSAKVTELQNAKKVKLCMSMCVHIH